MGKKINELEVTEKENFQNEKPRQAEKKKNYKSNDQKSSTNPKHKKNMERDSPVV